jgi:hypothetical protein
MAPAGGIGGSARALSNGPRYNIREPPEGDDVSNAARTQLPTGSDINELRPFRVEISGAAIDDLRERLARTRWPEKEPVGDWSMGIPLAYVH